MLKLSEVVELEILLDSAAANQGAEPLVYEGAKTGKKCVDEFILIREMGLLVIHVQYLRGGDLVIRRG